MTYIQIPNVELYTLAWFLIINAKELGALTLAVCNNMVVVVLLPSIS